MPRSIGSASDRVRGMQRRHAALAEDLHNRLDKIEEAEAKALPIIDRELADREYSVQSLEMDAEAITDLANTLGEGPSNSGRPIKPSQQSEQGSERVAELSKEEGPPESPLALNGGAG